MHIVYNVKYEIMPWNGRFKVGERKRNNNTGNSQRKKNNAPPVKKGNSFYDGMGNEIVGIILIGISLLMVAGIFTDRIGKLGTILRDMDFSIFGAMGYLFPFILLLLGVAFIVRKTGFLFNRRFIGFVLITTCLCVLFSIRFTGGTKGQSFNEVIGKIASTWSTGHGGIYGYVFSLPMVRLFGEIGSYIFTLLFILLGIVLILNMTVYEASKKVKEFLTTVGLYISESFKELNERREEKKRDRQLSEAINDDGFEKEINDKVNEKNNVKNSERIKQKEPLEEKDDYKDDLIEKYRKYREQRDGVNKKQVWFSNLFSREKNNEIKNEKNIEKNIEKNTDVINDRNRKYEKARDFEKDNNSLEENEDKLGLDLGFKKNFKDVNLRERLLDSSSNTSNNKADLNSIADKLKNTEVEQEVKERIELPSFLNTGLKTEYKSSERNIHPEAKRYNFDLEELKRKREEREEKEEKVERVERESTFNDNIVHGGRKKDIPKLRIEDLRSYREYLEDPEYTPLIPSDDPVINNRKDSTKDAIKDAIKDAVDEELVEISKIPYIESEVVNPRNNEIIDENANEEIDEDNELNEINEERIKQQSTRNNKSTNSKLEAPLTGKQLNMEDKEVKVKKYRYPGVTLLRENLKGQIGEEEEREIVANAEKLQETLRSFGVEAKVLNVSRGPSVTRYELQPRAGIKVSKITNLSDDIALSLAASGVRIEAPIPGKAAVGIEIPNKDTRPVFLREVIESEKFQHSSQKLAIALGEDISGESVIGDMAKFPHVLIAGATGSGKSVCINSLVVSLLYKYTPEEVRLIMVDPKVVELSVYNGIPHLLIPVVTDPKKATGALHWAVTEMTRRYQLFADNSVKNLEGYNALFDKGKIESKIPYIVIIVDELADLMMVSANEVEDYILRLSQMARAAGMHLVIATQRPSVDVITGVIKANIPSRISFAVSSYVDSKTILDQSGAEKLLGKGDMLYYPVGAQKPRRVQGAFISEEEVEAIVEYIKESEAEVEYDESVLEHIEQGSRASSDGQADDEDELMDDAIRIVVESNQASTSFLQRKMKIGYSRAARIMDSLEARGIISGPDGSKPRRVLWKVEDLN